MKKKKAKLVAGTVAIAMTTLLSSPGIVAHADTFNVAQTSSRMTFLQFNDGYSFGCPTLSVRGGNSVNGNSYAYCIDHELPNPGYGGHSYSGFSYRSNLYLTDSTVRNEVNWLIANYTPSIGSYGGFNASQVQYYVKQAAIAYLIGEEPNLLDATYNNPVKTAIEQTINAAKQHGNYNNEDGNTNVSLSAPSTTLTYNPKTNTYDSAMITESYSSNAINKQQGESGFPSGTKFIQNGQALNNIPSNGNFYISIPANEVTHPIDNMRVAIRSEFNVVSVQMIQPNGTNGLQRVLYPAYTTTNAAQWSSLNFNVKPAFGKIQIVKTGVNGEKLSGAKFEVLQNGKVDATVTTDSNGIAEIPNLMQGSYQVKEVQAPTGYEINNNVYNTNVSAGQTDTLNVSDQVIKGKVQIVKLNGNTSTPLAGAKFGVYASDAIGVKAGTEVATLTTNANGFATTGDLNYGTYTIKEIEAPKGYFLNKESENVDITQDKTYVEYVKDSPIQARLQIFKKDATNNKPLPGVQFEIINAATNKPVEFYTFNGTQKVTETIFTTNSNGEIMTPQALPYGNYLLKEVKADQGYNNLTGPIPFSINANTNMQDIKLLGNVFTMNVDNSRITGNLQVEKVNATTNKPVAGAEFKVTCVDGFEKGQTWDITSNTNGIASLNNIQYGMYTVQEIKAPQGYVINSTPSDISITQNGKTVSTIVKDNEITGKAEISKTDATTGKLVAGAKIKVTCTEGFDKGQTWSWTSTDQAHELTLPYGTYTYQETDAPAGYNINKTVGQFKILENGQIIKANIKDQRQLGKAEITKEDATTSKPVAGAKIEVTATSGLDKGQTWSWTSTDKAHELTLPVGNYTWQEKDAPTGYQVNNTIGHFTVTNNGITKAVIKDKKIEGKAYITKVNATNEKPVAGAKIKVTCTEGFDKGQTWSWTSTNQAHELTLPYGTYTYQETDAPAGYQINNTVGQFQITKEGQIIKATVKDYPVLAGGTQTTGGTLATTGQKSQLPFLIAGLLTILAAFGLTFGEVKKSKALKAEKSNNSTK
ncbi:SpaA isopeptide-forming pilin-related protein [Clostridium thermobutyricum]|uniref:SpaA isopeptide-forming pilin-related protein n=1 Tax=Clostridium thermobutyricum TaxID=29372 RepID=UPI0018A9888D|nr:SpaA isopeptide-forming pilin-related protein [Clostridium thermobutyricum]